jgi:phthiodiolone/phenolphthiodiolone dimycocerosates ketoreductase
MLLAIVPYGTPKQVAKIIKTFVDAGLRVPKILDYGAMAGLGYAEASAANVLAAEDELLQLCGDLR